MWRVVIEIPIDAARGRWEQETIAPPGGPDFVDEAAARARFAVECDLAGARQDGTIVLLEEGYYHPLPSGNRLWIQLWELPMPPSPSPMATSPASPLPPTSPDGAGASCEPVEGIRRREYQMVVQWLPECGDQAVDRHACGLMPA